MYGNPWSEYGLVASSHCRIKSFFCQPIKISGIKLNDVLFMVLEEEVWFSSEEEAQDCVKIFRSLNISANLKKQVKLENRVMYKAPFSSLKEIIEEEIIHFRDTGKEEFQDDIEAFELTFADLKKDRDYLAEIFASHVPGDHVCTNLFNSFTDDKTGPENEEEMKIFLQEASAFRILELNGLIDIDEEGMVLTMIIEPDDAVMTVFGDELPQIREKSLEKWEIIRSLEANETHSYIVTTGPDIVFLEDMSKLEECFKERELSEETDTLLSNLQVKQVLIAEIVDIIQKEGRTSKEDILPEFVHKTRHIDEELYIGFHLSPSFIESVINDMKKLGLLKGKGSRLKVAL